MPDYIRESRNRVKRLPERAAYDEETINPIIDAALICHVGFIQDGQPFVIPCIHGREGRTIYLHGAKASRLLGESGSGRQLCLSFAHLDGIVLARSLFHSSMNYRSVVAFGSGRELAGEEKMSALKVITDGLVKDRWDHARTPTEQELRSTSVVAVRLESASAKIRNWGAKDDPEDLAGPWWAGVLPIERRFLQPIPNEDVAKGMPVPGHVLRRAGDVL